LIGKKLKPDIQNWHRPSKSPRLEQSLIHHPIASRLKPVCACGGGCDKCQSKIQPKLQQGSSGDSSERQADQVADQVVGTSAGTTSGRTNKPMPPMSAETGRRVNALQSGGRPLPQQTKDYFENRMGFDFSQVRVHDDGQAAGAAQAMNARAYTLGNHLVLNRGEFKPQADTGKHLLAHELTHVVQQRATSPVVQRMPLGSTADLHQDIAANYRREQGLPSGGVDEFGNEIGPSDAEIIYRALWLPIPASEVAHLTPWELVNTPIERLSAIPQQGSGLRRADYIRARTFVRNIHSFINLHFDYETNRSPAGAQPDAAQLLILNRSMNQLLSTFNVRSLVTGRGGRGLPTIPGGTTPTLAGRVRLVGSIGDFAGKRYQLERSVGADRFMNMGASQLDSDVRGAWTDPNIGVTAVANARVTDQEKLAVAILSMAMGSSLEPAFYFPREDRIYLSPHVDLTTAPGADIARHESGHLLGGRETTRLTFMRQFGNEWIRYWQPFEEGVTEFINFSSRPAAQSSSSTHGGELFSGYQQALQQVEQLIASSNMGRDAVLRAFFTGRIPAAMFQRWQQIVEAP
jgi:hypothetical protein